MPYYQLDADISTPWLVFVVTGQWCLLILLTTFALAKHLPQRKNPFLVNFIFTAFIATIPPSLLLYADKQHGKASTGLCFAQVALMDGAAAMFGAAQLVLVFDTWSELRGSCLHKPHITRKRLPMILLILAPYIVMSIWSMSSIAVILNSEAVRYDGFAHCILSSGGISHLHDALGFFMSILALVGFVFELWVCWMIYSYPAKVHDDPLIWRTNIQFALRVLTYSLLLFIVVALSLINKAVHSSNVKAAYQLLNSTNALFAFVVFGTQKNIIRAWKFWDRRKSSDRIDSSEVQPQCYPTLDWADIPARKPAQFNGAGFEYEELGKRWR